MKRPRLRYLPVAKKAAQKLNPAVKPIIKEGIEGLLDNPYAAGEVLVNSEAIVGLEDIVTPKKAVIPRWGGEKSAKQIIRENVEEFLAGDKNKIFSPKDICRLILQKYPSFNKNTVGCQIISDSVNHTSRHHYPGGEDLYWWLEKGKYRLYDPKKDKIIT